MNKSKPFQISGNLVDVTNRSIFPAQIKVCAGKIVSIEQIPQQFPYLIIPGLIDAHVHIESSMLTPANFAKTAVKHGTVATVSDPHEIANVLGLDGIDFMIENGKSVPFKFYFGAPSCVPATPFETSGAVITALDLERLLERQDIFYLAEMMNYPGVLNDDREVVQKITAARRLGKVIDGHAPGLRGAALEKYIAAGITTDHECFTLEEALEKAAAGMKILIREGSAAKNFNTLIPLLKTFPEQVMFCSDDKHPDDLLAGHINEHIKKALLAGYDQFDVLRAATINPVEHYKLDVGLLRVGDDADFCVVSDLSEFKILETYIVGELVAKDQESLIEITTAAPLNKFFRQSISESDLLIQVEPDTKIRVIEVLDGELITKELFCQASINNGNLASDPQRDLLQLVVVNRYQQSKPTIGFVKGFGLKAGALASSVAHDSHNIVAVGVSASDLIAAIKLIFEHQGGISLASGQQKLILPLPIAGLLSDQDALTVAKRYQQLDQAAKELSCSLTAPFMTLSFLALLVIPELKLGDRGLFDGRSFQFVPLISA